MRKVIVAGNWKMNKTAKEAAEFFAEFKRAEIGRASCRERV